MTKRDAIESREFRKEADKTMCALGRVIRGRSRLPFLFVSICVPSWLEESK
jgi:hypothetical protein